MRTIHFVTSNPGKLVLIQPWLAELDPSIQFVQAPIEVPEYQSLDLHYVAREKAKHAFEILQKPVLIDDGGIYLEPYHSFPGPLAKYVAQGIGLSGIWKLAQDDPRAHFDCCLAYMEHANEVHLFDGSVKGTLIKPPAQPVDPHLPFTSMFVPEGYDKVIAEYRGTEEEKKFHHRWQALKKLVSFLKST